jgi:hypothetical protein
MPELANNISVCYVSDRNKDKYHIIPGEWNYNIWSILKSLFKNNYNWMFSIKLQFDPQTLVDNDKILFQIEKSVQYIDDHFHN